MIKYVLALIALSLVTLCECEFENSSRICERCDCKTVGSTFNMDCSERGIRDTLANWPQLGDAAKTLTATFSRNAINRLQRMPATGVELRLRYDRCRIVEIASDLFESCPNVTLLDLSYNALEHDDLQPDIFKGPFNSADAKSPIRLEVLNLAYNNIHSLHRNLFEHLPELKVLNLAGNDFKVLDVHTARAIASIDLLMYLNLSDNELTELPSNAVRVSTRLQVIDLSKNDLDLVPSSLKHVAGGIKRLNLNDNPIVALDEESFLGMDQLEELKLNNLTGLHKIPTDAFNPLINLKRIELSNNVALTEIDDEAFGVIQNLQELHLANNNLTNLEAHLCNWTRLRVLDVSGNPLDCTCNLYQIVANLSVEIKRQRDGPHCFHWRTNLMEEIYALQKDICDDSLLSNLQYSKYPKDYASFKVMKMSIVMIIMITLVVLSYGIWLAYAKWTKTRRNNNNQPFVSQIVYNPLQAFNT